MRIGSLPKAPKERKRRVPRTCINTAAAEEAAAKAAEELAKQKLVEAMAPKIKSLVEKNLLGENTEDETVENSNDNDGNEDNEDSDVNKSESDWHFNQDYQFNSNEMEGSRVFHQKFGYGKIMLIDGDKAEVNFEKSSQKKIFLKYLQFTT